MSESHRSRPRRMAVFTQAMGSEVAGPVHEADRRERGITTPPQTQRPTSRSSSVVMSTAIASIPRSRRRPIRPVSRSDSDNPGRVTARSERSRSVVPPHEIEIGEVAAPGVVDGTVS